MTESRKSSGLALVPFLTFIVLYLGAGVVLQSQGVEMAFYQFPAVVAILVATVVAFALFSKEGINKNFSVFARGAGNEDIMCMLMIFLLAGAFSKVAGAMGGVESTVNLCVSFIPPSILTAGLFIIAAFLSTATGTSMGTIGALVPIALGLAQAAGLNLPIVMAACVSGAMFGDNLSMISDTTISATRTQGVDLKDKFRTNFYCALPAALITIVLLLIFARPEVAVAPEVGSFVVLKVLPYILVLVLALLGMNVFLVLLIGILSAGIIGIAYGDMTLIMNVMGADGEVAIMSFAQAIWGGMQGMIEVFILSIFVGGIAELTKEYGGLAWLIEKISKTFKGKKSAQVGLCALAAVTDTATANNTVAILVDGQMASDISREYDIDPRKTASILDIFTCIMQGLIPYGAQFLTVVALSGGAVNPMQVIPMNWYLFLLGGFTIASFFIPAYEKLTLKGKWDWEAGKPVAEGE